MEQTTKEILDKLVNNTHLKRSEIQQLRQILTDEAYKQELFEWFGHNWGQAQDEPTGTGYGELKRRIAEYEAQKSIKQKLKKKAVGFVQSYRKIAAVLFLPLLLGGLLYGIIHLLGDTPERYFTAEAPLGQKARVMLPDGSTVWLNSGSSISYSSGFNHRNRTLELTGEAFFEVQKNKGIPFWVHTPFLSVKVTGTKFNVNAYNEEPIVETSLVEGQVDVLFQEGQHKARKLTPGNTLTYSKQAHAATIHPLNTDAVTGWMDNRLVFINDGFPKVVHKIERWYNVEVICNVKDFETHKLTVRLRQGEELGNLLNILEKAMEAECSMKANKVYITKKGGGLHK